MSGSSFYERSAVLWCDYIYYNYWYILFFFKVRYPEFINANLSHLSISQISLVFLGQLVHSEENRLILLWVLTLGNGLGPWSEIYRVLSNLCISNFIECYRTLIHLVKWAIKNHHQYKFPLFLKLFRNWSIIPPSHNHFYRWAILL